MSKDREACTQVLYILTLITFIVADWTAFVAKAYVNLCVI